MTLRDHRDALGDTVLETDVVIVGSGPGGAAFAKVMAAERGREVVVLEEGPARTRFRPNLGHTQRFHMQENGMIVATGDQFMPIAAGRGVGGGSLINSAICWRTPDSVLQDWFALLDGDQRFSPDAMRPVFEEIEALLGIAETPESIAGENNKLIVRGVQALGLPGGYLKRNTPHCSGCGLCNWGCPVGGKASVDRNLIPMAMDAGAIVQGDCKVETILVEGGKAVGVRGTVIDTDTKQPVGTLTVKANMVVVCAGGIGTPRLLHVAGLAGKLGPAVGKGLHVHPGNAVLGLCDFPVNLWTGATQGAWFEHPDHPGILPHTFSAPPGTVLMLLGKSGLAGKEAMIEELPRVCGAVVMVSDKGEGYVGARSDGRAKVSYRFHPTDVERIKIGMGFTAEVLLAGGAKELFTPVAGVGRVKTAEELVAALDPKRITDFNLYAAHPMASCRMGADPATSVVGATGEAHGIEGLYVSDSSVFPTSLGVNPQLTTMTMSTMIARAI